MISNLEIPLITVIVTTYNRRVLLPHAVKSVLNQTYQNYEIIIVNDRGDDVSDIVESFCSEKITLIDNIKNSGPSFSRNTALQCANGDIICYLDDDDTYLPRHLEVITNEFIMNNRVVIVYVDANYVHEIICNDQRTIINTDNRFIGNQFSLDKLLIGNYIPINSLAHKRSIVKYVGFFDERMRLYEDWDFLIRLAKNYNFIHLKEITVEVRNRSGLNDDLLDSSKDEMFYASKSIYEKYNKNITNKLVLQQRKILYQNLKKQIKSELDYKKKLILLSHFPGVALHYLSIILNYYLFKFKH